MCNLDIQRKAPVLFFFFCFPSYLWMLLFLVVSLSGLCLLRSFHRNFKKIHIWSMKHVHEELAFIIKSVSLKNDPLVLVWCRKDASSPPPQLCSLCFRFFTIVAFGFDRWSTFVLVIWLVMYEIVSVIHVRFRRCLCCCGWNHWTKHGTWSCFGLLLSLIC